MNKRAVLAVSLVVFAIAGCANKEAQLVGNWKGSVPIPAGTKPNPLTDQLMKGLSNMPLDLKQDHTFSLTIMSYPMEGTWKLDKDIATLKPTKFMGKTMDELKSSPGLMGQQMGANSMNKPLTLKLSDDGKTLNAFDDTNPGKTVMTFTKG